MFGKRSSAAGLTGAIAIGIAALARWCHLTLSPDEGAAFAVVIVWIGLAVGQRFFGTKTPPGP